MNFKEFFYNIFFPQVITEDYESILKQITKIIENNNLEKSAVDNILDIYNNVRVDEGREKAKKDSDLVALTYIYISKFLNDNEIKDLYSSYLNSEKSTNKNLLSAYITELQNEIRSKGLFKDDKKEEKLSLISDKTQKLIENIHRYHNKEEFKGSIPNEVDDKVYEDKDIVIFKADSKQKCIYYGRNSRLCISTKSGNYYWKYRMGKMRRDGLGMTTYFVYWKNEEGSIDEDKRILIDSLGNENGGANKYSWNPISPNSDIDISENELINKFPVLQKPFDRNVFEFIPYAEKEKRFQWIEENITNASELENYEDYEMWIQTDFNLKSTDWEIIEKKLDDKEMKKLLLLAAELGKGIPLNFLEKYFSEKEKERYWNKIAEDPYNSYIYAREVLKGQNVPDIILQGIAKDADHSYRYVIDVLFEKNVPEILIQGIAKNPHFAYGYADFVLGGVDVPEILVQSISKDPEYSYRYAKNVLKGKNIPESIIQSIAQNSEYSYYYVTEILKGQKIPDIIFQSIVKSPGNAYRYATEILDGQNVPEFLVQSIAKNPQYSYNYATEVLKGENVPEILIQSIAKNPQYSYDYATAILNGQNVPEILIQSIATSAFYSYNYAIYGLNGKNVPDIILQGIAKEPLESHNYATSILKGQNVPEILIQSIAKRSDYSYFYAKRVLKGQNVPEILLKSIAKDPHYSQQSLTEATLNSLSTDVIRSNSTNINSIEDRNFSSYYSADASSVIRDSRMDGFIGEGIFDDSNQLVGYGYGYRMGADGEYNELEYIDTDEITFFNDNFKNSVITNGIENICTPENTFYISNLVVDKPYRLYVKRLLNGLLNRINNGGYKYIAFDGLSDTIRLFDSARKSSRLSGNNLIKLAEVDQGESKLVLFYIK
jgi:hypothetical protein